MDIIGVTRKPVSGDRYRYTAYLDDGRKAVRVSRLKKAWACVRAPDGGTNKGNPAAITLHGTSTSAARRALRWKGRGIPARSVRVAEEVS